MVFQVTLCICLSFKRHQTNNFRWWTPTEKPKQKKTNQ